MGKALEHISTQLEDIARGLFEVKSTNNNELIGLCPVHEDKSPSFSYNYVKDVCHCYACGFSGDIIQLWSRVRGSGDAKADFIAFCSEYNIEGDAMPAQGGPAKSKAKAKKKESPNLDKAFSMLEPLPAPWVERLQKSRGWHPLAIEKLQIKQQSYYQAKKTKELKKLSKPDRLAIPIFDAAGAVRNIRLYKPGAKKMKIISWGADYGAARLFPPVPLYDGAVLVCEGESDTICAISHGFNAITQTSKPKKWSKDQLSVFKGRDIVIAFDADLPGQMYATKYAAPELLKVAKSVRVLKWPGYMMAANGAFPEDHGQDLTDFFVKHKKSEIDFQRLMDNADHFKAPPKDITPEQTAFFERGVNDRMSFKPRLLAEKIMEEYKVLYCPDTDLLYKWNGRYWEEFSESHLKSIGLKKLGKDSKQSMVLDAVFQIKALSTLPHGRALNDDIKFVCVKNGMLNITTGQLIDHDPQFYASYELGVTYNPESKDKCTRFLQFLDETIKTPEVKKQVQEFFGYCLLRQSPFAKCLLLLGPGSDGKSTLLAVLRDMIGAENCASVSFAEMEDQFLRSSLYQKTVNISTEVGSKAIESPYFKAITSGDPVNAAFKHKNTFTFTPFCKQVFASNKMPRVRDNSDGFFRRILPIKFKTQFLEGGENTDPFLKETLLAEKSEVFHWALAGLARLMKTRRFTPSEETEELLIEYKRLNNPVICFIQDVCEISKNESAKKKELYKVYETYCRQNGYRALSNENFFKELYSAYTTIDTWRPSKDNPKRLPCVKGLKIRTYLKDD
ncbi:MAG: DNA primase [Candidatus Marinimicrobia bacterium]|jgi:putative DNA primase/helicase|nr:DNA primase [Candidatus Neomarinimicrobiota bacterium]